ncbi:MAG: phosphotransferase [Bacilli bacterium]|nr:phosphotransferase [Bacilli bacterium]
MRFELTDNLLTLFFEGELNSYNADVMEKEVDEVLSSSKFQTLNLDFAKLHYISSAGLRIILKIKQKHDDSHVINANLDVYDVLQMTGFTNIMDVKKAMREMSVEGAEIIGEGFFSTVYRIDKDTIIKVFNRTSDEKQIERELKLAKQAFVLGIPTAISFDIVKVKNKLGVRFEMLDCMSLKNAFIKYPEKYDELLNKYVDLLKKINTTECFDPSVPSIKKFFIEKVDAIKHLLDEAHYEKLLGLMKSVPERSTFVHGDCHFKNIMVQGEDFLLIDMDTLSVGHPIFELANLRCPYVAFEEDAPGNCEQFFGMKAEYCVKLYDDIVRLYFGKEDEVIKDKIALVCYAHMVWWTLTNQKDNQKRLNGCKERLIALLDKYNDIDIGI